MVLKAWVKTAGPKGEQEVPLEKLYMLPIEKRRKTTILKRGEFITAIQVPISEERERGIFLKSTERKAWSSALASVALQLRFEDDQVAEGRIALGGVAPIPWRAKEAEKILRHQKPSEALIQKVGQAAVSGATPMQDNAYKIQLVRDLVMKALIRLSTSG